MFRPGERSLTHGRNICCEPPRSFITHIRKLAHKLGHLALTNAEEVVIHEHLPVGGTRADTDDWDAELLVEHRDHLARNCLDDERNCPGRFNRECFADYAFSRLD